MTRNLLERDFSYFDPREIDRRPDRKFLKKLKFNIQYTTIHRTQKPKCVQSGKKKKKNSKWLNRNEKKYDRHFLGLPDKHKCRSMIDVRLSELTVDMMYDYNTK